MKRFLLVFMLVFHSFADVPCHHNPANIRITNPEGASKEHIRVNGAAKNIRITRYYDPSYMSMPNRDNITKLVLDPAIEYWQETVKISNPFSNPLIFERECTGTHTYSRKGESIIKVCSTSCVQYQWCGRSPIPNRFIKQCFVKNSSGGYNESGSKEEGASDTDLLIIVTQKSDECTDGILAYATACLLEKHLDRPILGLMNICPGTITLGVGLRQSISIIKHELVHILGFSKNLYAFYRNETGFPLTPRDVNGYPNLGETAGYYKYSDITIKKYLKVFEYPTGLYNKMVSYLVTPNIQKEIRKYFNCTSLEGMMLEDYGSPGSALSHFEKLYMQNELMTATSSINGQVSRLTLALLQDTGWYTVNMDKADDFNFAKNLGCDFVTKSCYEYIVMKEISNQSLSPYCNQVYHYDVSCSPDMRNKVYCNLYDDEILAASIPNKFKYFTKKTWVSNDDFSDYCPFPRVKSFMNSSELIGTGECNDHQNNIIQGTEQDYFNEGFGNRSMCIGFYKKELWNDKYCNNTEIPQPQGAGCYEYQCSSIYGLVIVINNIKYQCRSKGEIINVTSTNTFFTPTGALICPDCSKVCKTINCVSATSILPNQNKNIHPYCPQFSTTSPYSGTRRSHYILNPIVLIIVLLLTD